MTRSRIADNRATILWLALPLFIFGSSAAFPPNLLAEVEPEALYDKSRVLIIGIEQYPQGRSVPGAVEEA